MHILTSLTTKPTTTASLITYWGIVTITIWAVVGCPFMAEIDCLFEQNRLTALVVG